METPMQECESEVANRGVHSQPLLSRDQIASLCDLDRECCGPSDRGFLWWRGVVAEDSEPAWRRQVAYNFIANQKGEQKQIVSAAAWQLLGRLPNGKRQWRLLTVFTEKRYRFEGLATQHLCGYPIDIADYEVIADVAERDLVMQKVLRRCGWHGFALTRLDGNGVIRFRADFIGVPELDPPTPPQPPKPKRKPRPPRSKVGAKK